MYSGGLCGELKRFLWTHEIRDTENGDNIADERVNYQAEMINHGRKINNALRSEHVMFDIAVDESA